MRIKSARGQMPEKHGFPGHGRKSPVCGDTPDDAPVGAESLPAYPPRDDVGAPRRIPLTP